MHIKGFDGSATFDSAVTAYRIDTGQGTGDGSTQLFTGRSSGGTPTSKIFSDGSAEFAGNVGIGLTSPGAPLAVASSGGINARLVGRDNGTVDEAQLYFMHNDNSTVHGIIEGSSTSLKLYGGTTLAQTIDSSGNVGIGTPSPPQSLTVNGVARFENFIEFGGSISTPATAASIYRPADNNLAFGTASVERMRIDISGNVKIAGTLPDSPNISLNADGSATFANTVQAASFFGNATGSSIVWYGGATGTSIIKADGSVTFAGNVNVGSQDTNASSGEGSSVQSNGVIRAQRSSTTSDALSLFSGYKGTSETFRVNVDGSAEFAGTVDLANGTSSNTAKLASRGNDVYIAGTSSAANIIFKNNVVSTDNPADSGTEIVRFGSDGSAEFAGYVGIETDSPSASLEVSSSTATGIISHAQNAQATDTNKALRITNGNSTVTFSVSYKGKVSAANYDLESLPSLP